MSKLTRGGVWPTMTTPFTMDDQVDYEALGKQVEWYISRGVSGLFAVCQSSEMFFLSLQERAEIARFVRERAGERVPVIASGHISDSLEEQAEEVHAMSETGVDAVVLITNRLAREDDSDEIWIERMEELLRHIPKDTALGLYECPYPYKRLLSEKLIEWCASSGRFRFLKDTSCDIAHIRMKLEALQGSGLQLFNANSATLLESLKLGVAGYSGVMANFHPELYARLINRWEDNEEEALRLSDFLSLSALIEKQLYPVNAKYNFMLEGVYTNTCSRTLRGQDLTATQRMEVEQLSRLTEQFSYLTEQFSRLSGQGSPKMGQISGLSGRKSFAHDQV
ncbi:dihydrodipicolinate synthase family protein [Paenibacillus sp. HB172176]|uniref:dihydrodipicolinate synthase family protein n=1 Tax=Paenibacillus sp. HB172176 TaxID=2493690 RepID=UPI001439DFE0|nr:dihydrodipicolinate synthase family protein [Paenibacillus sp. HB172176]